MYVYPVFKLQGLIKDRIPTSFESHSQQLSWAKGTLQDISREHHPTDYLAARLDRETKIAKQLGTLGGGNHFIEVVYSEGSEQVWCMLHSGSRNVGNTTASFYDQVAGNRGVALRGHAGSLNYLEIDSADGQDYLKDMQWCQAYARENRRSMLDLMVSSVEEVTGKRADMSRAVNAHHNFCQCEKCRFYDHKTGAVKEKDLWVTRKGATSARAGQYGIIPGSMGVGSYIVKGRGARGSWQSCSHGAGRTMSRTRAKKIIPQEDFEASMRGIICDTDPAVRDEAPQAYKDLGQVLKNQADLVEVEHRLLPLVNVKGFEEKGSFSGGRSSSRGSFSPGGRKRSKSKKKQRKASRRT
ncbi:rtcB [Symbiodinium pilosum]|uniref:3'-phosphate/5'-hydroxy nucleic acid ligase n=1 Tax=Symbiodinium pilosum TaxID=2952 RepID=A0A812T848_SYMPI|nr:rtcB [Symbiodinium pilosum]